VELYTRPDDKGLPITHQIMDFRSRAATVSKASEISELSIPHHTDRSSCLGRQNPGGEHHFLNSPVGDN
jgi:hypothetical protein